MKPNFCPNCASDKIAVLYDKGDFMRYKCYECECVMWHHKEEGCAKHSPRE